MKVKELIKKLEGFDKEQTVFVGTGKTCSNDKDIKNVEQEANKEVLILTEEYKAKEKLVKITVWRGVVTEVEGLPEGYTHEIDTQE